MTWAYALPAPGLIERVERAPDDSPLAPGQIRVAFLAGGLCGSDLPLLRGLRVESVSSAHGGAPIHEIVGRVTESASTRLPVGTRVVGTGAVLTGLSEILTESEDTFISVPADVDDVASVLIQSIATVLRAVDTIPDVSGSRVAVIGAGPIGLIFTHVLRRRGVRHLTVVDPVVREGIAARFGADEYIGRTSTEWLRTLNEHDRPDVVIEAVGHQHDTVADAVRAVADNGFVLGFGGADDDDYTIPFREMYERGLTLRSGRTRSGWVPVLEAGRDYLRAHCADFAEFVSHALPVGRAQEAYDLYASPRSDRLKVVLYDDAPQG